MKYARPLEPHGPAGTAAPPQPAPVIEEFTVDLARATGRSDRWLLLAVVLGTIVIGFGLAGRLWAPPVDGSEGAVASIQQMSRPTVAGSISVSLRPSATTGPTRGEAGLLVDGYAPSGVESVVVDVRTGSGALLASAVVRNELDERPGSDGRPREGAGRLYRQLFVPGPILADGWQVEITWRLQTR